VGLPTGTAAADDTTSFAPEVWVVPLLAVHMGDQSAPGARPGGPAGATERPGRRRLDSVEKFRTTFKQGAELSNL
jgi:hypothetical protein